jgi:hypothetical protein
MKINTGKGTPIWLSPRADDGITIVQGTSRIMLSAEELPILAAALLEMSAAKAYQ